MEQVIKERNGGRRFERVSRWNALDYTVIADRNRFAQYADNAGNKNEKLTLTYFRLRSHIYPLNMFGKLVTPIQLEDFTMLSRQNVENCVYYLEISPEKDKVRVYKEITV